ncbi:phage integrase SAM-like domain-containing protein [Paenibacillus glucanolyticus]|uniref:phage integrase SAM-like domain-containing protein n=1 Tax=Paenibacillus glucanolyticus TaxID=59843 RepID=UPI0039BF8BF8
MSNLAKDNEYKENPSSSTYRSFLNRFLEYLQITEQTSLLLYELNYDLYEGFLTYRKSLGSKEFTHKTNIKNVYILNAVHTFAFENELSPILIRLSRRSNTLSLEDPVFLSNSNILSIFSKIDKNSRNDSLLISSNNLYFS